MAIRRALRDTCRGDERLLLVDYASLVDFEDYR
jgi:hypothetical protein